VSTLTLDERAELLFSAVALHRRQESHEVVALLSPVSRRDLIEEPELGIMLAQAQRDLGNLDETRSLIDALAEPCRRRGYDQLYRRRLYLEGAMLVFNEPVRAGKVFSEVLHRAVQAGDARMVALMAQNLGVVAAVLGEFEEAIAASLRAITALESIGWGLDVVKLHRNLGMLHHEVGLLAESDSHFETASQLLAGESMSVLFQMAAVETARALTINSWGDHRRAEATVRHALDRLETLAAAGHPHLREHGEAFRVMGIILLTEGNFREAKSYLERSAEIARGERVFLLEGECYEALFVLAREEGDSTGAEQWAAEALRVYRHLGARARAARVLAGSVHLLGQ
jgi:tetratricopeptide (TPR) repeat protein